MALVTFYALTQTTISVDSISGESVDADIANSDENVLTENVELASELAMACELLMSFVGARKKVTVLCETQAQAESFDDFIWQLPANKFIPHNLYGEGPDMGTPVEIIWHSVYLSMSKLRNTAVVINLSQHYIENTNNIKHIIDFVPVTEEEKVAARQRYKQYKQAGMTLEYKSA